MVGISITPYIFLNKCFIQNFLRVGDSDTSQSFISKITKGVTFNRSFWPRCLRISYQTSVCHSTSKDLTSSQIFPKMQLWKVVFRLPLKRSYGRPIGRLSSATSHREAILFYVGWGKLSNESSSPSYSSVTRT